MKRISQAFLGVLTSIGGFVDVGTVATAVGAGAAFGLGLSWALVLATLAFILLIEMSGRLAAVSGKTYAASIRERFGFKYFLAPLTSEFITNVLMLAANIGGVAMGISLLTGIRWNLLVPAVALLVWAMIWRAPFKLIENGPPILGLVTLSFVVAIFALGGPSAELWRTLWQPSIEYGQWADYLFMATAIIGAAVSPVLMVFYSSGAREETWTEDDLTMNKVSASVGMGFGGISAFALIVLSAMVLQPRDISGITLTEVGLGLAEALGPLGAQLYAFALLTTCFGACLEIILGMGYNVAQGFGWEWGKEQKRIPAQAPRFYLVMLIVLLVGLAIALVGVDPLQLALVGSAVTALLFPITLSPILVLMNDRDYMGDKVNSRWTNIPVIAVLVIASVIAAVSLPLLYFSGG